MADIQILGANTDTRSQIKNLWASLNQLTAYVNANSGGGGGGGGGSGTGNVLYSDTTATVGQHYKINSTDGTACVKSDIVENNGIITFNNNNLQSINYITVNRITCNQIVKSGLAGFFRTNGLIDYNTYATPTDVSNFYLSKLDAISTYLNKNDANFIYLSKDDANFIYLSKSAALSITGALDTRIISLETKNQYQNTQPNQTNFSGTVQAEMLKVIGGSSGSHLMSDGSLRNTTQLNSGGAGTSLIKVGSGYDPVIELNSISNGSGLGLVLNANNISLSNITTLSNAGLIGSSLVVSGSAPSYSLKSIEAINGLTWTDSSDVISIRNTSPASDISLASVAGGISFISSTSANPAFKTKSITQGTGITISDVSNNLTITNSSPASAISLTTTAGNYSLISSASASPSFVTKSISAGAGISIVDSSNNLAITGDLSSYLFDLQRIDSFFIGASFQHGSGLLTNMSNSLWSAAGSSSSSFLNFNPIGNNFTRQLCCAHWSTTALADGAPCGYVSTASTGIQVSTGFSFGFMMALGIADSTYYAINCQNFWGLQYTTTGVPIVLNQTTQLSSARNMICFGSNTNDANICIYTAGASSTVKQVDLGSIFPAHRPSALLSTNFYKFFLYWDGTKFQYKAVNTGVNITVQGSFTPLPADIPSMNFTLYPQCLRIMGSPQVAGQAKLQVQRFGVFY